MFKISTEMKTVPTWFNDFEPKKLIDHPVKSIRYLIWLMQAGAALSVLFSVSMAAMSVFARSAPSFYSITFPLITIVLAQVVILGIHARSKLAWLLLASGAVSATLSPVFFIGFFWFWLLDQDEVVAYFKNEDSVEVSTPQTATFQTMAKAKIQEKAESLETVTEEPMTIESVT